MTGLGRMVSACEQDSPHFAMHRRRTALARLCRQQNGRQTLRRRKEITIMNLQYHGSLSYAFEHAGASRQYCLVVVPTYNEAQTIAQLLAAVLDQGPQFDILVVDDNSPDGTAEIVAAIAWQTPRVQLL